MDMQKRREATKKLAITISSGDDSETLNIVYRPQFITAPSLRALAEAEEAVKAAQENAGETVSAKDSEIAGVVQFVGVVQKQIQDQVLSWDLTDSGVPVPITAEGMDAAGVDVALMTAILVAIRESESPK